MMISSKLFNNEIVFNEPLLNVLVIENKLLFREVICSFENDSLDDLFIFSENYKPFDFKKCGLFISNPINIDFDSRKLSNKVNSYLEQLSETELSEQLLEIKKCLFDFADRLLEIDDYEHCYDENIETIDFIKMLDFKIEKSEMSLPEQLVEFMKMCSKYLNIKLFVIQNLHLYFTNTEIAHIYEAITANHLQIFIIDSFQPSDCLENEKYLILDEDLCIIDDSVNL